MPFYQSNTNPKDIIEVSDPSLNPSLIQGRSVVESLDPNSKPVANPNVSAVGTGNFGSSTTTQPTGTLVDRLTAGKKKIDESNAYSLSSPNETQIRDDMAKRAQSLVNAVNAKYATIEANDAATADLMNRERRAGNVLGGLSGSNVGSARTIETAKQGDKLKANTAAQKEAEINAILTDAETRGTAEFKSQRDAFISQQKDRLTAEQTLASNIKSGAENELSSLASKGYTFADLKSKPALLANYLNETGMTEDQLSQFFLSKTPSQDLLDPSGTKLADGTVTYHVKTYDRAGNVTGVKEVARIAGSGNKPIKQTSISPEGIFILYTDGSTEFKPAYTGKAQPKAPALTTEQKNLESAGLSKSESKAQQYFLATPPSFQDEWNRNVALGVEKGTTTDAVHKAYTKWFETQKNSEVVNPFK